MPENEPEATASEDKGKAVAGVQGLAGMDEFFQFLRRRTRELKSHGMPEGRARGTAMLEHRIAQWPADWGDELRIIVYGDFTEPATDLRFPDLGIVVEAGAVKETIIRSAMCVLKARVTVSEKTVETLVDAGSRINMLLGILAAVGWCNSGSGWWCHVTHGSIAGLSPSFEPDAIEGVLKVLQTLQPNVRTKIVAALHWIREPRQMLLERYRSDVLRVYAGYWNAFECLVEAVCLVYPQPKLGKLEKQAKIDRFIANRHGKLDVAGISECYRLYVDPGFVAKASHALRQCFPDHAEQYIVECFKAKPEQDQLYKIRNAINHGDIDAGNLQELIRVDDKYMRLWMIVFGMLGKIIPIPAPIDPEST